MINDLLMRKKVFCISYPYTKFSPRCNRKLIAKLIKSGADIIELVIDSPNPFNNHNFQPAKYFLKKKNQKNFLDGLLKNIKKIRKKNNWPIIIKSDTNTFLDYGLKDFFKGASEVAVSAIHVIDLPPEESKSFFYFARNYGVELIFSLNSSTSWERISNIMIASGSLIYFSSNDLAKSKAIIEKIKSEQNKINILYVDENDLSVLDYADGIVKSADDNLAKSKLLKMVKNQRKRLIENGII